MVTFAERRVYCAGARPDERHATRVRNRKRGEACPSHVSRQRSRSACSRPSWPRASAVACDNPGKTHNLKFKVKNDECVEKVKKEKDDGDADTINVCETDKVIWKVSGRAKSIVIDGDSTPFAWQDSGFKDKTIEGTVKPGTAGQEFKYSVKVDGLDCVLDPKIIVQP